MWMIVLRWVKEALGLQKLAGTATIVMGVLVLGGAALAWIRDDAKDRCDARWKLEIARANEKLLSEIAQRDAKLVKMQDQLRLAQDAQEAAQKETAVALEKQREQIPLSEACMACRVPNEHLWVRPGAGGGSGREGGPQSKGGGVATEAPRKTKLFGPR